MLAEVGQKSLKTSKRYSLSEMESKREISAILARNDKIGYVDGQIGYADGRKSLKKGSELRFGSRYGHRYGMIHASANAIRNAAVKSMVEEYESHGEACAKWYSLVAPANEVAFIALNDAIDKLKSSPKWKKKGIRAACEECQRLMDRYDRQLMSALSGTDSFNIDRRQFIRDYLDSWQDSWNRDVFIIRMSISNFLLKVKYTRDVELASYVFTAYNILCFACNYFDAYMSVCLEKYGVDIRKEFADGRLGRLKETFKVAANSLDTEEAQDLHRDKACRDALQVLSLRMTSSEIAEKASATALKYNGEVREWFDNNRGIIEKDCKAAEAFFRKKAGLDG